jgi:hypothetical protein
LKKELRNDKEINEIVGAEKSEFIDWNLEKAVGQLETVGFIIINLLFCSYCLLNMNFN